MMEYLAHSAKEDCPPQSYEAHVKGVFLRAVKYAGEAENYALKCRGQLEDVARRSAILHDLGKLCDQNQTSLHEPSGKNRHLPVNHVDAGSAALIASGSLYSALAVYSHHRGLPDIAAEEARGDTIFRDEHPDVRDRVDHMLQELIRRHQDAVQMDERQPEYPFDGDLPVFFRMMLSCLADADHTDTAVFYSQAPDREEIPQLRANERLAALDQYVLTLGSNDIRSRLRREMYLTCRDANTTGKFTACDSPVGSGKTTAVMAHLLKQAVRRKARRVFVILPYTSIIQQSVDVYRKALVLPGENPESVVSELHCRADFQDQDTRYLTSLWRTPVIVTTAVAFFETIASNHPYTLRRLHELPGSVIFVDESHNALPLKLLPLAWRWMNILAKEWGCYWVLASGSLVRFWQLGALREIEIAQPNVSDLVHTSLRTRLMKYEQDRISFYWKPEPLSRDELTAWVQSRPGPRLLIMNTVQSAAVIADDLCRRYGRNSVEHLSTALTPEDRDTVIKRIKARLVDKDDAEWTLVATSCVEAGVDFSFRTGFRELSSLLSLLQAAGRVNRHGAVESAEMWSFSMQDDSMLKTNPALETSREVLRTYFNQNMNIVSVLSTQSLNEELTRDDSCIRTIRSLIDAEDAMQFKTVDEQFEVIDSNTVSAVVDEMLAKAITFGKGDWRQLQRKSVSIRREKIQSWNLKEIAKGVYQWTLRYDSFLGYMHGVLDTEKAKIETLLL